MEISFISLTNFFANALRYNAAQPTEEQKENAHLLPTGRQSRQSQHTSALLASGGLFSWLLAACSMIGPFATDMYLPSFHQMAQAFGSDLASVQMTLSSYLAGFAVMTLFYGTISDMFGRKLTMVTGFLCFSASSLGAATSPAAAW